MATFTVNVKQQQRLDTAANWTAKNPTLLVGELGIESDTGKIKCGNGVTAWSSLAYIGVTTEYLEANYLKKTANAVSATKLATARTIGISGVTATAQSFNGTANIVIPITAIPTSLLSGNIDASRIAVTANSYLGNNTTLSAVLTYIANVFAGSQAVTKIKAGTFDTTS